MARMIDVEEYADLDNAVEQLSRTTALIGILQTAVAEGGYSVDYNEAAEGILEIYYRQCDALRQIKEVLHPDAKERE